MPPSLSLPLPNAVSSILTLTTPYTRKSLKAIRVALQRTVNYPIDPTETHAAVLFPLFNYDDKPGILLELRGKLRTHSGQVSCPGGRVDPEDESLVATALRETHEEVGISPEQVEILGQLGPPETSVGGLRVWPFVGFVHADASHSRDIDESAPLPSPHLSSLIISTVEVETIFHLPLSRLVSTTYVRPHQFRGGQPYYACDVTDLIDKDVELVQDDIQKDEIVAGGAGKLEVWGLTGWYLNLLCKAFGLYR